MARYASDWEDEGRYTQDYDEPGRRGGYYRDYEDDYRRPSRFFERGTPPRGWRPAGDNDVYPSERRSSRYDLYSPYEGDRQDYSGRRGWRDR